MFQLFLKGRGHRVDYPCLKKHTLHWAPAREDFTPLFKFIAQEDIKGLDF